MTFQDSPAIRNKISDSDSVSDKFQLVLVGDLIGEGHKEGAHHVSCDEQTELCW